MYDGTRKNKLIFKKNIQKAFLIIALFAVIATMTILTKGRFISFNNIINVLRQMSINLIIAVGMTLCIISGGVDLSVGSVGIMAGSLCGVILVSTNNILLGIMAGVIAGLIFGLFNGILISKFNVLPFIGTLATMTIARGLALFITGGDIITGFPEPFLKLGVGFVLGIPTPVIIMGIVLLLGWIVLSKTEFGLNIYALGGNAKAARLAGLRNSTIQIRIYMITALLASIGGILMTARVASAQPNLMQSTNLDVIAAVIVGGTSLKGGSGSITNTIIGSILMASLFNGLNIIGIGYEWQQITIGLIIAIAVTVDMVSKRKDA
jgi:ribose transport system permease protein